MTNCKNLGTIFKTFIDSYNLRGVVRLSWVVGLIFFVTETVNENLIKREA